MIESIAASRPEDQEAITDYSTCRRIALWVVWFLEHARKIMDGLKIIATDSQTGFTGEPVGAPLAYFVRAVVNSGNWIQHRTV